MWNSSPLLDAAGSLVGNSEIADGADTVADDGAGGAALTFLVCSPPALKKRRM